MAEPIHLLLTAPKVTPANVSGGGGSRSELVITWEVRELEQGSFTGREPSVIILCGCGLHFH